MKLLLVQGVAALLSAILLASLWEPFGQSSAIWFALVPLLLLTRHVAPRRAAFWGFCVGLVSWVSQLWWMLRLTENGGPWPLVVPALLGLSAVLALFVAAFAGTAAALRRRFAGRVGVAVGLTVVVEPMLWAATECLRSRIFTGFAWNPLGLGASDYLPLVQLAAVGGAFLVSALVVAINGALAAIVERLWASVTGHRPGALSARVCQSLESVLPFVLLLVAFLWGLGRIRAYDAQEKRGTAVIIAESTDDPCLFSGPATPQLLSEATRDFAGVVPYLRQPDMWLWPESSASCGIFPQAPVLTARINALARTAKCPLLVGGLYEEQQPGAPKAYYNAAILISGNGFSRDDVYAKRHLVPFGEFIPGDKLFPSLQRFAPTGVSNTPGTECATLRLPSGLVVGPLICFEDTVTDVARESVLEGAQVLVNMSNDAWYAPSCLGAQHARQALFRAIETGVPLIRSTNRGQNCAYDAVGRPINAEVKPTELPLTAQPFAGPYLAWGDALFGAPCILFLLCLWVAALIRRLPLRRAAVPALLLAPLLLGAAQVMAEEPLLPVAIMAVDDRNLSLAERTASALLKRAGLTPEEKARAEEVLIRTDLARQAWDDALARIEATPELPAVRRLTLQMAAYNGKGDFTQALALYDQAHILPDDEWGIAALRLALRADLELGKNLRAIDRFAAIDAAPAATARVRAENALEWVTRFPNDRSRTALLQAAASADKGGIFLSCALAMPKAFAEADNRAEAVAALNRLLALQGLSPTIEAQLALAAASLDATRDEALLHLRRAHAVARDEALRRQALTRLGNLLCADAQTFDEGLGYLNEAVCLNPSADEAPALQLQIAETLQQAKRYQAALDAFERYLEGYDIPAFRIRVRRGKAAVLLALARPDEALATLTEALSLEQPLPARREPLLLEAADAAFAATRYTRAVALLREHLATKDTPAVRLRLARALEAEGKTVEAIEAYIIVRENPSVAPEDAFVAVMRLGALYAAANRLNDAIAEYTRALSALQVPTYREALRAARARLYYTLGQLARAKDDFAAVRDSTDVAIASEARFFLVLCLYGLGEDDLARELAHAYVSAYPESPRIPDIVLWIAKSDFNRGAYEVASAGFRDFVVRWPGDTRVPQVLLLAARAAYQDQDYALAVELIGRLAKEFPQATLLPDARFLQVEALMELARHAEARDLLEVLLRAYPNAPWIGEAYGRRGDCLLLTATDDPTRYPLALEACREALSRLESDPDLALSYFYKIGRIFEKQGHRDDAAEQYQKLVYRVLSRPSMYSEGGLTWFRKALAQLRAIEISRGNRVDYERLLQRVHQAGLRE